MPRWACAGPGYSSVSLVDMKWPNFSHTILMVKRGIIVP